MLYNQDQSQTEAVDQQLSPGYKCLPDYLLYGTDLCTVGNNRIKPITDEYGRPKTFTVDMIEEEILREYKDLAIRTTTGYTTREYKCRGYTYHDVFCWTSEEDYRWLIQTLRLAVKERQEVILYGAVNAKGNIADPFFCGVEIVSKTRNNVRSMKRTFTV